MVIEPAHLVTFGIGIGIALSIFLMVRKNHLMVSHAVWWLVIAFASMAFGVYPKLIDRVGAVFGIHDPPTLLIVIGMGFILIKMLTMDLKLSEQERKIRALTQRLAIVESDIFRHDSSHPDSGATACFDRVNGSEPDPAAAIPNQMDQKDVSMLVLPQESIGVAADTIGHGS